MFTLEIVNLTKQKAPLKELKLVAQFVAKSLKLQGELSLVLAGDSKMRSLNRDFRKKDKPTDVLTFPANDLDFEFLGEIFINLNDCKRPRKYQEVFSFSPSYNYLLFFLLIHGLLHLAGYSDEKEKGRLEMIEKGEKMMKLLVKNAIIKTNR
jgi:probable rRNA maturation factor